METKLEDVTEHILHRSIQNLKDPLSVKSFVFAPENQHPQAVVPLKNAWNDLSLSSGYPGLLLLFAKLCNNGFAEEDTVHEYVLKIKESIEREGIFDLSLYSGVAGIAFALQSASCSGTKYQKMIQVLHQFLLQNVGEFYFDQIVVGKPLPSRKYDVIQGLSGLGRYILENLSEPGFFKLAEDIATTLVQFVQPIFVDGNKVPGWFLPPTDTLNRKNKTDLKGNFNLGLAHGIPGVLSFLSLALARGVAVDRQRESIKQIIDWIVTQTFTLNGTIRVPYSISWDEQLQNKKAKVPCRDAWCYGIPGVARTLYMAGKALEDKELKRFSLEAFRGVFTRTRQEWNLPGPMLCHGIAGLLAITKEMAIESGCEELIHAKSELLEMLISSYQEAAPFGFKDIELSVEGKEIEVNKPGFLEGTAGVLLSLIDEKDPKFTWHLPLLIHD